jgi:hypothetical protein
LSKKENALPGDSIVLSLRLPKGQRLAASNPASKAIRDWLTMFTATCRYQGISCSVTVNGKERVIDISSVEIAELPEGGPLND